VNEVEIIVKIPEKVDVTVNGFKVSASGAKGKLAKDFSSPLFNKTVKIVKDGQTVKVSTESTKRKMKSQVGCVASHIKNLIKGAASGYSAKLKVVFMHFPVTVKTAGKEVTVANFLGEKAPRRAEIIGDAKVEIKGEDIFVSGTSKEDVSQTAANIEIATRVAARDRRVFQDGIFVTEKVN
jgi:large subunit ribosomal protein L6